MTYTIICNLEGTEEVHSGSDLDALETTVISGINSSGLSSEDKQKALDTLDVIIDKVRSLNA